MALSKIRNDSLEDTAVHGRRNLIINGAMQVAQRGTSSGSISSNGYSSLDRWYVNASGGTYTLSQEDFTVGQTDVPDFPKNYMKLAVTTGDNNLGVHQRVEDVTVLGGKTVTLSFWAKGTNPAGGSFVSSWIQDFGSGGSSDVETEAKSGIVLTSSWQKFTITFDVPSVSGKTIGTSSYTWVEVLRQPATDTGTAGWTADIAQVQLEVGEQATPFEHRSFGEELSLCQRYTTAFDADGSFDNFAVLAIGRWYQANAAQIYFSLPVTMRNPPTLDSTNTTALGTFSINIAGGFTAVTPTGMSLNERGPNAVTLSVDYSTGGQTAGTATTLYSDNADVAKIVFEAEL